MHAASLPLPRRPINPPVAPAAPAGVLDGRHVAHGPDNAPRRRARGAGGVSGADVAEGGPEAQDAPQGLGVGDHGARRGSIQ